MKKTVIFCAVVLLLAACSPSEADIQAAINQTETARPTLTLTVTVTPEPTASPLPLPTSTPDFIYFTHLDFSDVNNMFIEAGISCEDREFKDDGSYMQDCFGPMDGGLISGFIAGNSENTVGAYFFMVTPFIGSDITDYCKKTFSSLLDFGESSKEMQSWIEVSIGKIANNEENTMNKTFEDARLQLSSASGVISLMVISNP